MPELHQNNRQKVNTSLKSWIANVAAGVVIMAGINGVLTVLSTDYEIDTYDGQTVSACSGHFYDSRGSGGKYKNNEDYTITFAADNGGQVAMTFTSFSLRSSGDYLYVYDGANTSATLIGRYGGSALSGQTLTSTTGYLTFRFTSNQSKTSNGWEATISCTPPPVSRSISSFPYSESFESGLGDWSQSASDDIDWTRDANGTPSSYTGPSAASDGTYYYYLESSSPNYPNKEAILNSPTFDLSSAASATLSFYYHMYGYYMGSLVLEVSTDGGTSWTSLWSKTGNQGSSWVQASVNLDAYVGGDTQFRFKGTTGSGYRSDMAIDQVELSTTDQGQMVDTDQDGILDNQDIDDDNDGILDADEGCAGCSGGVILNGDFEAGPHPGSYTQTNENNVSGWETTAPDNKIEIWKSGFNSVPSKSGSYFVEINSSHHAALYQHMCTRPGTQFSWSVWHRGRAGTDRAVVKIGDDLNTAPVQATMTTGTSAWKQYSGTYTVPSNQTTTYFIFESVSTSGGNITVGNFIDNIVITESAAGTCLDTDQDGIPNSLDLDSDNDGIPDLVEAGGIDRNGDGMVDDTTDTDKDGLLDILDNDDTDGPSGSSPCSPQIGCLTANSTSALFDTNQDGVNDLLGDRDGDNIPNWIDLDADNDGILDVVEAGGTDLNRDGILDGSAYGSNGYNDLVDPNDTGTPLMVVKPDTSTDVDTRPEYLANTGHVADTDGDDVPDFLDVDSDNDGIYDVYEAQASNSFTPLSDSDQDSDGIDNSYDDKNGFGGNGAVGVLPVNSDNSDLPDYRDTDSDDDYISDMAEAWDDIYDGDSRPDIAGDLTVDTDGDGLVDAFDDDDTDASIYTMVGAFPPNDDGGTGSSSQASQGVDMTNNTPMTDIFPGNQSSGTQSNSVDYRSPSRACASGKISYAMTDSRYSTRCLGQLASKFGVNQQNLVDTIGVGRIKSCYRFDKSSSKSAEGASTTIARATAYCLKSDAWYRFYNPAEPEHFLFAIKNGTNTVPLGEVIDYIEIELQPYGPKDQQDDNKAFIAMERSWKVVQKKALNGTVSIRFYFEPKEYERVVKRADYMATSLRGTANYKWFKTDAGIDYDNLPTTFNDYSQQSMVDLNDKGGGTSANSRDVSTLGGNKNYVQFDDLTSFSGGTLGIEVEGGSNLPVEWLSFDAQLSGKDGVVTWATATETNASHFEVERSLDGRLYQQVGQVRAAGTTRNVQNYRFVDERITSQPTPNLYYRLRQVDLDGAFEYSNTIELSLGEVPGSLRMEVYPNPANERVTIEIAGLKQQANWLRIFNMSGQQVYAAEVSRGPIQEIPLSNWVAGTYTAYLTSGENRVAKRLVVVH